MDTATLNTQHSQGYTSQEIKRQFSALLTYGYMCTCVIKCVITHAHEYD